jgi:hypothetical protein
MNNNYRHIIYHSIHWKTACKYINELIGESLSINESKIECHKENYFRIYVNGNPLHYVGVFLNSWGEIITYEFMAGKIEGDKKISHYGRWRGEKKEVATLLCHVHDNLKKCVERNANETKLLNILDKFVLRKH